VWRACMSGAERSALTAGRPSRAVPIADAGLGGSALGSAAALEVDDEGTADDGLFGRFRGSSFTSAAIVASRACALCAPIRGTAEVGR